MRKIAFILVFVLLMAGCGNGDSEASATTSIQNSTLESVEGYKFIYNNIEIKINAEAASIVSALGEPKNFFESPSCAFQGVDKFYYYNSFEIDTYPINGVDYIYIVKLLDDSISTPEGAFIGCTLSDVKTAYGDGYTEKNGFYTYTLGKTTIEFVSVNDIITEIKYIAITNK